MKAIVLLVLVAEAIHEQDWQTKWQPLLNAVALLTSKTTTMNKITSPQQKSWPTPPPPPPPTTPPTIIARQRQRQDNKKRGTNKRAERTSGDRKKTVEILDGRVNTNVYITRCEPACPLWAIAQRYGPLLNPYVISERLPAWLLRVSIIRRLPGGLLRVQSGKRHKQNKTIKSTHTNTPAKKKAHQNKQTRNKRSKRDQKEKTKQKKRKEQKQTLNGIR